MSSNKEKNVIKLDVIRDKQDGFCTIEQINHIFEQIKSEFGCLNERLDQLHVPSTQVSLLSLLCAM
jgi:hypothetical protein